MVLERLADPMSQPLWELDGNQARFSINGALAGALDLLRPGSGLDLRAQQGAVNAFAVELAAVDADAVRAELDTWVRDGDLVATYEPTQERPTRGQIYWRVHCCGGATPLHAVDLIVSVQTNLLDSEPKLSVRSRIAAAETLRLISAAGAEARVIAYERPSNVESNGEPACYLFRLRDGMGTYVEMVHPLDFTASAVRRDSEGNVEVSHRLFQGRLEKGVILRSRLRALFLPREGDVALASDCYREFAASEPPLTT